MVRTGHKQYPEFDEFEESSIETQREAGWELLAYDSDIPYKKRAFPPAPLHGTNDSGGD